MTAATTPEASRQQLEGDQKRLVGWLSQPSSFPERTGAVACIETHISWVFLTDHFVYKLKKPVRFDFLDFSTIQRREWACRQEVELNRRLAAGTYLGVLAITLDARGRLGWGGSGRTLDWVVQMRRLPAEAALDQLLLQSRLQKGDVERLAARLAQFYQSLPPIMLKTEDYRQAIQNHVNANEQALLDPAVRLPVPLTRRVHIAQRLFLRTAPDMLDNRVRDGRIVNGHGDLRPEHIYLTPAPVVIDCVEFNAEFRTVDVIDELGFLAMECDHRGAPWIGQRVIQRYLEASHDAPPPELMQFYQSYRACVRAKVHALRARQLPPTERERELDEAARYLDLAQRDAATFGKPWLLVVRGLPGSGKSTLATTLADGLGCELLQTDALRRDLYGAPPTRDGYDAGRYALQGRMRVYAEMLQRAEAMLRDGVSVTLDGTFLSAALRVQAVELARRYSAEPLVVCCTCPPEIALTRINEREQRGDSLSEARAEFYELQRASDEPDPPGLPVLHVDTTRDQPSVTQAVFTRLRARLMTPPQPDR